MNRDRPQLPSSESTPVVAAQTLLRIGLSDDAILAYLARTWPLDDAACRGVLEAARTGPPATSHPTPG